MQTSVNLFFTPPCIYWHSDFFLSMCTVLPIFILGFLGFFYKYIFLMLAIPFFIFFPLESRFYSSIPTTLTGASLQSSPLPVPASASALEAKIPAHGLPFKIPAAHAASAAARVWHGSRDIVKLSSCHNSQLLPSLLSFFQRTNYEVWVYMVIIFYLSSQNSLAVISITTEMAFSCSVFVIFYSFIVWLLLYSASSLRKGIVSVHSYTPVASMLPGIY